jgi:glutathione S-transferase
MDWEQGSGEEHRARHPLGRVPVIETDDGYVFESTAICLYLADLRPDAGVIGEPGSRERALDYQWSVFAPGELEPPLIETAIFKDADPERAGKSRARFVTAAAAVEKALDGGEFLVADRFGVADVLVSTVLWFTSRAGFPEALSPPLKAYVEGLQQRPAFQRARERASVAPASA